MRWGIGIIALVAVGCGGRMSHTEWRVNAMRAEMRLVLPQASEKLACHAGRLETDLIDEQGASRTYAVRGCGGTASYLCETGVRAADGAPEASRCIDARRARAQR